jgi:hypothetical protein
VRSYYGRKLLRTVACYRKGVFMRRSILSIMLLFFVSPLAGQTPPLEPGAPLRVHARGFTMSGELVRWDADTLVVRSIGIGRPAGTGPPADVTANRAIAMSDVLRLDRKVPRTRGQGAARGALWGLIVGGVAGGFLGAIEEPCDPDQWCIGPSSRPEGALLLGGILGGLGAGVGALVGTAWPGTRWEPTGIDPAALQPAALQPAEADSR